MSDVQDSGMKMRVIDEENIAGVIQEIDKQDQVMVDDVVLACDGYECHSQEADNKFETIVEDGDYVQP